MSEIFHKRFPDFFQNNEDEEAADRARRLGNLFRSAAEQAVVALSRTGFADHETLHRSPRAPSDRSAAWSECYVQWLGWCWGTMWMPQHLSSGSSANMKDTGLATSFVPLCL